MYRCDDASLPYNKFNCKSGTLKLLTDIPSIQADIMNNGPVMVGMMIYDDFMSYQSGVYTPGPTAKLLSAHAVKLIGWDEDLVLGNYWIAENQWTSSWGESGYFRIAFQIAGIDDIAYSCSPNV